MTMKTMLRVSTLAAALALAIPTLALPSLASAATHHHRAHARHHAPAHPRHHARAHPVKVCKWERHHGRKTRVCHMTRH